MQRIPRSNEFDLLRLVLAVSVVLVHCRDLLGISVVPALQAIPAVPIFIFISGVLVTESALFSKGILDYTTKRLRRILPAYMAVVFAGAILVWCSSLFFDLPTSGSAGEVEIYQYLVANVSFLNFLHPCLTSLPSNFDPNLCAVNGSLWTLKFEVLFYCLLPFFLVALRRAGKGLLFVLFLSCLALLASGFVSSSIYRIILVCFLAGVFASLSRDVWLGWMARFPIPSLLRSVLVLLIAVSAGLFLPLPIALPLILLSCLVPTVNASHDFNALRFGDLSYALYLVHFPLIQTLGRGLKNALEPGGAYLVALTPWAVLALSTLFAAMLYWHVERRFLAKGCHFRVEAPVPAP